MPFDTPKAQIRQPGSSLSASPSVDPAQEAENFLEQIAQYNKFGKILRRESLKEVGQQLARIAEMAEVAVTNEADDWFDAHTLKRNFKEVRAYAGEFLKLAEEADTINQRMTAFYDDMGRILERYFEIPDVDDGLMAPEDVGQAKEEPIVEPEADPIKLKETLPVQPRDPKVYAATPLPPVTPDPKKVDALTLRAIQAVHTRLKKKNPDAATRFAQLDPAKMKEIVWILATKI